MHLYLAFESGRIRGEGTDYVGPWVAEGSYDLKSRQCQWNKQYLGKHNVLYQGLIGDTGIQGNWEITFVSGPFHIWPKRMNHLNEMYLQEDLSEPTPSVLIEPVFDFKAV